MVSKWVISLSYTWCMIIGVKKNTDPITFEPSTSNRNIQASNSWVWVSKWLVNGLFHFLINGVWLLGLKKNTDPITFEPSTSNRNIQASNSWGRIFRAQTAGLMDFSPPLTPPKIHVWTWTWWGLEDYVPPPRSVFSGSMLIFWGVVETYMRKNIEKCSW